jgi:hypothetical protein
VVGSLQVLEQSIKLIERINDARKAIKNHTADISILLENLEMTRAELKSDQKLIQKIPELRTDHVEQCAARIKKRSDDFCMLVTAVSSKASFWHKLTSWISEKNGLDKKMEEIKTAEGHLRGALLAVNVGLTKNIHDIVAVDETAFVDKTHVDETNTEVQKVLGNEHELSIAKIIKGRVADGML